MRYLITAHVKQYIQVFMDMENGEYSCNYYEVMLLFVVLLHINVTALIHVIPRISYHLLQFKVVLDTISGATQQKFPDQIVA